MKIRVQLIKKSWTKCDIQSRIRASFASHSIFGLIYLNMAYNGFTEKGILPRSIPFSILPVCTAEGNWGISSLCCSISLILVGIGVGFGATVSLLTGAVSGNKKVIIVQLTKNDSYRRLYCNSGCV